MFGSTVMVVYDPAYLLKYDGYEKYEDSHKCLMLPDVCRMLINHSYDIANVAKRFHALHALNVKNINAPH